jgi:hypothetical protein
VPQRVKQRTRWRYNLSPAFSGAGVVALAPPIEGSNADRIAAFFGPGLETPHFSYNTPADPSVSDDINVTAGNATSLQNAIATANRRVLVPAGTYNTISLTGSAWANNVDLVLDNAAVINCNTVDFGNRSAIRITGGRFNVTQFNAGGSTSDILLQNVRIETDSSASGANGNNWLGAHARIAFLNTTINVVDDTTGVWGLFTLGTSACSDWFILGCRIASTFTAFRLQNITRVVLTDTAIQAGNEGGTGIRFTTATDVFWRDVINRNGIHLNHSNVTGVTPDIANLRAYRLRKYSDQSFMWTASGSSGELYNSEFFTIGGTDGASPSISPFTGMGNVVRPWDGSTMPSLAAYGADH